MYGYDGNCSALEWLAFTGDPLTLTKEDQKRFGLHKLANDNRVPTRFQLQNLEEVDT